MKINPGIPPAAAKKPVVSKGQPPLSKCWRYSFRCWRQIDLFGVGDCDPGWFISFLDRLKQLSAQPLSRFMEDFFFQQEMRYHEIDWQWRNIPISRADLNWLTKDVLDNAEEYPIYQIHISQAMGRIIGYWDEDWIFNIVLLDPKHNCQPSAYSEYQVRATSIGQCNYSSLRLAVENAQSTPCNHDECERRNALEGIPKDIYEHHRIVVAKLDDATADQLRQLIEQGKATGISEVLTYGIELFQPKKEIDQ